MPNSARLSSSMGISVKTILWDNDGVLVDTEELYFQASREILAGQGLQLTMEQFREVSLRQGASVLDQLLERGVPRPEVERLRAERNEVYRRRLLEGVRVCDGVEEALRSLAGKVRMGVVTSTLREHFEAAHASTSLSGYFDFVLAREDYRRSKPDPDPYLTALSKHDLHAGECIAVEDSERGLRAAAAAGIRCYIISNDMTGEADFSEAYKILGRAEDVVAEVIESW